MSNMNNATTRFDAAAGEREPTAHVTQAQKGSPAAGKPEQEQSNTPPHYSVHPSDEDASASPYQSPLEGLNSIQLEGDTSAQSLVGRPKHEPPDVKQEYGVKQEDPWASSEYSFASEFASKHDLGSCCSITQQHGGKTRHRLLGSLGLVL